MSWILDIATAFTASDIDIKSLVSSEGLRWIMRNAMPVLNNIAWGEILLAITALGLLQGSGIIRVLKHLIKRQQLTKMEKRSLLFSLSALLVYSTVLYVVTLSQWNILLGVTGTLENSSFIRGLALVLFIGVLVVALIYGFMYGNYRSVLDAVSSIGNTFSSFVPAIIALIPASAVMASVNYIGLLNILDLTSFETNIIVAVFYSIPFLYIMLKR
ncbi:MAG: AbgT family transporter [Bacteroidaceae bacterium]|nr:AbgT family transporter [Bacteroidaceae bacterium]